MKRGLVAKMDQNPDIKQFLLDTRDSMLLEANPTDPYWGVRMSMYDKRIWIRNSWLGKAENNLGRLLAELRTTYNHI